jgi:hypothetical protein
MVKMAEKIFFGKGFNGRQVYFEDTQSTWTLSRKILEKCAQDDERGFMLDQSSSVAWAIYECENAKVPVEKAIMKIYMQYVSYLL